MTKSGIGGLLQATMDCLNLLSKGPAPQIARTEVEGIIISTVMTHDMGPETAVFRNTIHPVQRYGNNASEAQVLEGHERWVARVTAGERTFTDVGMPQWGIDPEEFTL